MPAARNRANREAYDLILTTADGVKVRLMFDRRQKGPVNIPVKLIPFLNSDPGGIQVR